MGMSKGISIKYGWNTVAGTKIMHVGHYIQDLLGVKSIPAAKSQNIVDISGAQNSTLANFLEFTFFYLKRQGYIDIATAKIKLGLHHLYT